MDITLTILHACWIPKRGTPIPFVERTKQGPWVFNGPTIEPNGLSGFP